MSEIQILDACCGGKMFWFDKLRQEHKDNDFLKKVTHNDD